VLVAPGTYVENIDFIGKAITVTSSDGAGVTVIDGNQAGSVVRLCAGEKADSVFDGFTITNGSSTFGGGIRCWNYSSPTITNNVLTGNTAYDWDGGGISCCFSSSPIITNNTIMLNTAKNSGGGIHSTNSSSPVIANSIVWNNDAPFGPQIGISNIKHSSSVTISYSDVKGGQSSVHVDPGCTLNWGSGMIGADPLVLDSSDEDFHLTWNSPCKDTGDNTASGLPDDDFEGDPRIAYGTVDMGADEFYRHLYYIGNPLPGGDVELKFVDAPWSQVGLIIGGTVFDPPIPGAFGDWHIKPPMILIPGLGLIPPNGVYVLPGTLPTTPTGPYPLYFQAMIDWKLTNLCTMNVE